MADKATDASKPKSTAKRDKLRKIELDVQKEWEQARLYEANAPANTEQPKYFVTFPFPYMNGCLHLGHSFTVTKAEFAARYEKLKGKNALFPFGFHCTGMPIKACADKIRQEIAQFGNPPQFPEQSAPSPAAEEPQQQQPEPAAAAAAQQQGKKKKKEDPTAFHGRKAKVAQKSVKRQWDIMLSNGIKPEDIPSFSDPQRWLDYFPPVGEEDLRMMGVAVDWRRSFITTDANPYYDSFVRWHFETLRDAGKLEYGKRYTVYSPLDGQPCADHDRSEGEGVGTQEYVLIKMEVAEPQKLPKLAAQLNGRRAFFVAGTLRPETMYGQTNCWILPEGKYGAFEVNDKEVFICTHRAARNMAFQGLSKVAGQVSCIAEFTGQELLGTAVRAPLAKYPVVYMLPMLSINPDKSTGVVTSVPSDSPDDYMNFMQLKNKPEYRKKLGVEDEWIMPFELVPIIRIPEYGDIAAEFVCKELKIKGPNDKQLLEEAKERTYLKGFYNGEMIIGPHAGSKVKDAKTLVRDEMMASGEAAPYCEPSALVVSRSGDECVVALCDQWYIKYGETEWRAQVERLLSQMELYHQASYEILKFALGWMSQWACSRNFGLGTHLPWDPQYLIESLSDSTIYMAYYTVAHMLQGGDLKGSHPGPMGIAASQMTRGAWDYVFLGKPRPADCPVPEEKLAALKREFDYWYPLDLRVSGKDLLQNHLLFSLYNHCAVFPEKHWPRAFRANGHLLINGDKMSKSTGNFLTLREAIDQYSADGMRIALADAGDGVDDANFVAATADSALLRLHTQLAWAEDALLKNELPLDDSTDLTSFQDRVFDAELNRAVVDADRAYSRACYRQALVHALFDLQSARDLYRSVCEALGVTMKRSLVVRFVEVQAIMLSPIAPHFADHVWRHLLHKTGFIWSDARWPQAGQVDEQVLSQNEYVERVLASIRVTIRDHCDPAKAAKRLKAAGLPPQKSIPAPTDASITIARSFPEWTVRTYEILNKLFDANGGSLPAIDAIAGALAKEEPFASQKLLLKKAMSKAAAVQEGIASEKAAGRERQRPDALTLGVRFDEQALLAERLPYISKSLKVPTINIVVVDGDEKVVPGAPGFVINQ
eukprot:m51a1_g11014 putative leucyl-trna synthetase (1104) ;mRNA; r:382753-386680